MKKKHQVKHITDDMVKKACNMPSSPDLDVVDCLIKISGCPYKVCLAKLYQCDRRGLIEYGIGIHRCWWTGE